MTNAPQLASLPRVSLANLPTPLEKLDRLSSLLGGVELWIKRDDLTGLATGGNKTRKLEFLIADAIEQGADCVITAGGPQSNHCRQTAAACARYGLSCHVVLGGKPVPPVGNLLLDQLLGAQVHWVANSDRDAKMESLANELTKAGHTPYVIPVGGSNAIGAVGYAVAFSELTEQLTERGVEIDRIVFATSSGGTQAGLMLGAKQAGFRGRITPISIDQSPDDASFLEEVCCISNGAAQLMGSDVTISPSDVTLSEIEYGYLGGGYGVVGDLERDAIRLLARTEGILVGPVYSGRALGALVDKIRTGKISAGEKVLFWHTGDESALHAYADDLK